MTETFPDITRHAADAAESLRAMSHTMPQTLPAPILYDTLAEIRLLNARLADAMPRLTKKLYRSLDEFDVYQDDGGDPRLAAINACQHLHRIQDLAEQITIEVDAAQQAIAHQGFRPPLPERADA